MSGLVVLHGDPAKLFTDGDWMFETSKSIETPWAGYTLPAAFVNGIGADIVKIMASVDQAADRGECSIGTSFGEMPKGDIFY